MLSARNEGYVFSGLGQACPEITAGAAGPKYGNPHKDLLKSALGKGRFKM
jgi:hypothetical protein